MSIVKCIKGLFGVTVKIFLGNVFVMVNKGIINEWCISACWTGDNCLIISKLTKKERSFFKL